MPPTDPTTTEAPTVTTTLAPPESHGDVLSALVQAEGDFTADIVELKSAKVQMDASVSKAAEDTTTYNAVLAKTKAKLAEVRKAETDAGLDA